MRENSGHRFEKVGGIGCLMLTLCACLVSIFTKSYFWHALFVLWLVILFTYFGFLKQSIVYLAVYVFTVVWLTTAVPRGILFPSPMLLGMIYKFIVPVMAAYLTFHIPSGKLIAVFQKCAMPRTALLILVVIIRFIPTISEETRAIWEAMRVRGFVGSGAKIFLHPLKTMEYAVVPLIFRSIKVADELAAASIVRGIEKPGKKESYYSISISKTDVVILVISGCLLVVSII